MKKRILTLVFFCVILQGYASAQCGPCSTAVFSNDSIATQISATEISYDNNTGPMDTTLQMRFTHLPKGFQLSGFPREVFNVQFTTPYDLPLGVNMEVSDGGAYNVIGGDSLGCVRLCSQNTPPGIYHFSLPFDMTYSAVFGGGGGGGGGGFSFDTVTSGSYFNITLTVTGRYREPYLSFEFMQDNLRRGYRSCNQGNLYAESLIDDACYIKRQWNRDGQNVSTSYAYSIPTNPPLSLGNHFLALTTRVYDVWLKSVTITANGVWDTGPDSLADIYIRTKTHSNIANHTVNQQQVTFDNLNWDIPLSECNNFEIEVMDYDGDNVPVTNDIRIDGHWFTAYPDTFTLQRTNSRLTVIFDTVLNYQQQDTFWFLIDTFHASAKVMAADDSACEGDVLLLTAVPYNSNYNYSWQCSNCPWHSYDSVYVDETGDYRIQLSDTACYYVSPPVHIVIAKMPFQNAVVQRTGDSLRLFPHQQAPFAVKWYLDGNLYALGPEKIYAPFQGNYTGVVYNLQNPECFYEAYNLSTDLPYQDIETAISVYPNPSNGYFEVSIANGVNADKLDMLNALGQKVHSQVITGNKTTVDGSQLPAGIYLLQLTTQAGIYTTRMVLSGR